MNAERASSAESSWNARSAATPGCPPAPTPTGSPSFSWSVPSRARNASAQTRSAGGFMICCRKRTSSGCCVPERVGYPNPPIKTLPNLRQALSVRPSKFLSPGRRRAATRAFSQWIHELRGVRVDGQVDGQWQIVGSCDQDNREPKIYCACRANPHAAPNWLMGNSAAELRARAQHRTDDPIPRLVAPNSRRG